MIHKKATYGKTEDIMVVEMGSGDIQMCGGTKDDFGRVHLCLKTTEDAREINVSYDNDFKSFDEMKPELVFMFSKVESIDSLIAMLEDCKKGLLT